MTTTKKPSTRNPKPQQPQLTAVETQAADAGALDPEAELQAMIDAEKVDQVDPPKGDRKQTDDNQEINPADARELAEVASAGIFWTAEQMLNVNYPDEVKARGADKLMPVLAKRGGQMPPWAVEWKEEIKAGVFFASVIVQTWSQIKQHELSQKKAAAEGSGSAAGMSADIGAGPGMSPGGASGSANDAPAVPG